jgi:multicomponent Na+:H+ antiporter MnhC subunit
MELIYSLGVGIFFACGVWLLLRPRTFQVILGLALLSYATNLFIFAMGRLTLDRPPLIDPNVIPDPVLFDDPIPQALVLTAIVIGFATTALFLVMLIAARGFTGTDHVDGVEKGE